MNIEPLLNLSLKQEVRYAIKRVIKQLNKSGETRLPGEIEFADALGVSRPTIRDALKEFEQEGVIFKVQGKGTFLNPHALKMEITLNPAFEFGQIIEKSGYQAEVELLNVAVGEVDDSLTRALNLRPKESIVQSKKVFYADQNPVIYCEDFFAKNLIRGEFRKEDLGQSIFEYLLKNAGIVVTHDIVEVAAAISRDIEGFEKIFKQKEPKALLLLQSVYYTAKNKPVMRCYAYFDTSYIKLNLLRRQDVYFND